MAASLSEVLLREGKRPVVIADCEQLIEEEVAAKSGLTGLAVKGAFAMVKAVKPGILRESVDMLLDDFVKRIDPFYTKWLETKTPALPSYMQSRSGEIADALLGITDARAQRAKNGSLKKAYEKLRPQGKKHVEEAMPRLGRLIEKHQ